ncbi:uncharacterized protein LOC110881199 [Helianthus annuus]|uniref:uncharacterized protein LOC110881199 n=1 Tax=Helianthus annuus TaxID=4232 RepID=UPI000B8F3E3F|nr:uncharacterized protein LOC110881199 [Helianthus annuus]
MGGHKFTYMSDDGSNLSKIDRILVCDSFMNKWPAARFEALTKHLSDHSPLILACANVDFGPIPFRFYNSWLEDEGIGEVIRIVMEESTYGGNNMIEMANILKNLKIGIKEWRRTTKSKEEKEVQDATKEVENIEKVAETRRLTETEKESRVLGKWKIRNYERKRLKDLKQKAKLKWAKLGDESSNFFHRLINCRKARNRISTMKINGVMVTDPKAIKEDVRARFMARFSEPIKNRPSLDGRGFKKITKEQANSLTERFSNEEIKKAVWACGSDRAPGPDGFSFKFIKRFWEQLKDKFGGVLNDFYDRAFIERGCNASFIALIPKVRYPQSIEEYRPISLIGVIYKIIAKILACWLKKVIPCIVDPVQTAFVEGRSIFDGPLITSDIISWAKKSKKKMFIFKVDFEKAYDSINWKFLLSNLKAMGFPSRWTDEMGWCMPKVKLGIGACLKVNLNKSSLYGLGAEDAEIEGMAGTLNCKIGSMPFNFLGLTIGANMKREKYWKIVLDEFNKKLSAWKAKCLSFAGRMVLAKAVMGALPNYFFSMYLAPKKVIKALDTIRRDFIWGRNAGKYKIRWIAWGKMTKPKQLGGFGLGDLRSANLALMAKWWWKYKTKPEELWTKVIRSIHVSNRCYKIMPINNKYAGIWKDIVAAGKELGGIGISTAEEIVVEVGTGNTVKFWLDNWCGGKIFKEIYPALFKIATNRQVKVADCVIKLENENQWSIGWLEWKTAEKGEFSVAEIRKQIIKQDGAGVEERWKNWNRWVPPKVSYFTWRATIGRIPVKKELIRRRIPITNQLCSRCEAEEETADHVICGCISSKAVWKNILIWLKLPAATEFQGCREAIEYANGLTGSKDWKKIISVVVQTTMWNIWKSRNEKEFEGNIRNSSEIAEKIMADSFIWLKSISKFGI